MAAGLAQIHTSPLPREIEVACPRKRAMRHGLSCYPRDKDGVRLKDFRRHLSRHWERPSPSIPNQPKSSVCRDMKSRRREGYQARR